MQHDPSTCTCPCHVVCEHRRASQASSRSGAKKASEPFTQVLVMIRVHEGMYQRYINSISSVKSILNVYGGKSLGIVDHIKILGGNGWEGGYVIGLILFQDMQGAQFWYRSDVLTNQPDWMYCADIIAVPMQNPLINTENRRCVFLMGNFFVNEENEEAFQKEFLDKAATFAEEAGGVLVASSKDHVRLAGNWKPGHLRLVQFPDEGTVHRFASTNKEGADKMKETLERLTCGCRVLLETNTNMPATPSYKRPFYC